MKNIYEIKNVRFNSFDNTFTTNDNITISLFAKADDEYRYRLSCIDTVPTDLYNDKTIERVLLDEYDSEDDIFNILYFLIPQEQIKIDYNFSKEYIDLWSDLHNKISQEINYIDWDKDKTFEDFRIEFIDNLQELIDDLEIEDIELKFDIECCYEHQGYLHINFIYTINAMSQRYNIVFDINTDSHIVETDNINIGQLDFNRIIDKDNNLTILDTLKSVVYYVFELDKIAELIDDINRDKLIDFQINGRLMEINKFNDEYKYFYLREFDKINTIDCWKIFSI